ncbi:bifunctional DNA primase/polymerase [Demequina oxidasica]|uniref:bifunctional DNA primase/polymerase n=1 Tax=Demequina oxidasica TaxID=676199 RepID=UPI00078243C8|nr:bifunctional DNA primase/polymerase [Demequina oxidasica]
MSDVLIRDAALGLTAAGWEVLPCSPQTKAPLTAHGHLDATQSAEVIGQWWMRWPGALIGVKVPADAVVLDIDPRNGGSLDTLLAVLGPLPDTMSVLSGRGDGGQHLYYARPPVTLRGRLPGMPGVDIKKSGYMIAPPSPHPSTGKPYRANMKFIPNGFPGLPGRAVEALTVPAPRKEAFSGEYALTPYRVEKLAGVVLSALPGERNSILYWAACRIFEHADPTIDVNSCLDALADAAQGSGLSLREIESTVNSARKASGS